MVLPLPYNQPLVVPNYFNKPIKCLKCSIPRPFPIVSHPNYQFLAINLKRIYVKAFLYHFSENAMASYFSKLQRQVYDRYFKLVLDSQVETQCNPPLPYFFGIIFQHLTRCDDPRVAPLRYVLPEEIRIAFVQALVEVGDFCFKALGSRGCLHEFFDQSLVRKMINDLDQKYGPIRIVLYPEEIPILLALKPTLDSYGIPELDTPEGPPTNRVPALVTIADGIEVAAAENIKGELETPLERSRRRDRNHRIWYPAAISSYVSTMSSLQHASLDACLENLLVLSPCFFLMHLSNPVQILQISLQSRSGQRRKDLSNTIDYCISGALDDITPLDLLTSIAEPDPDEIEATRISSSRYQSNAPIRRKTPYVPSSNSPSTINISPITGKSIRATSSSSSATLSNKKKERKKYDFKMNTVPTSISSFFKGSYRFLTSDVPNSISYSVRGAYTFLSSDETAETFGK